MTSGLISLIESRADCAFELYQKLVPEIEARSMRQLYETMDLPLSSVLARMESHGIRILGQIAQAKLGIRLGLQLRDATLSSSFADLEAYRERSGG